MHARSSTMKCLVFILLIWFYHNQWKESVNDHMIPPISDSNRHHRNKFFHGKLKFSKLRVTYYANTSATLSLILSNDVELNLGPGFSAPKCSHCETTVRSNPNHCASLQIILSGDIEINPGPVLHRGRSKLKPSKPKVINKSPPCNVCTKGVGSNRKRLLCSTCFDLSHVSCSTLPKILQQQIRAIAPYKCICTSCTLQVLPFFNNVDVISSVNDDTTTTINHSEQPSLSTDKFQSMIDKQHLLKICHLNTQSMLSTFDEFECLINQYLFDIITLSETWLKDNQHVLDYVRIPGYSIEFRNRKDRRGVGVGIYLRDNIKSKVRSDIINLEPDVEHIWLEIEGKNKHSHVLIGNLYQPNFNKTDQLNWLDKFEAMLTKSYFCMVRCQVYSL